MRVIYAKRDQKPKSFCHDSRKIDKNHKKNVITIPAPEFSFAQYDPGKLLQAGRHLSTLEKVALAEFVVAGNVHKLRNARDVIAAWCLNGHAVVFPIDTLGSVASRTATLPRKDIADLHRVMWTGPPSTHVCVMSRIIIDYPQIKIE